MSVLKHFEEFTGKHRYQGLFFNKVADLRPPILLKETPTQLLSCEYCEIFKKAYFEEHIPTAAFE